MYPDEAQLEGQLVMQLRTAPRFCMLLKGLTWFLFNLLAVEVMNGADRVVLHSVFSALIDLVVFVELSVSAKAEGE